MSDVLHLQDTDPEAPDEEKSSYLSLAVCRNSFKSYAICKVGPV